MYGEVEARTDSIWKFRNNRDQESHLRKELPVSTDLCTEHDSTNTDSEVCIQEPPTAVAGHVSKSRQQKVDQFLFLDGLKLYGNDESLIDTVCTFRGDTRMEFRLGKCGVLVAKRYKIKCMDGLAIPSVEVMKQIGKRTISTWGSLLRYGLGVIAWTINV